MGVWIVVVAPYIERMLPEAAVEVPKVSLGPLVVKKEKLAFPPNEPLLLN